MESNSEGPTAKRLRMEHFDWDWEEYADPQISKIEPNLEFNQTSTENVSSTENMGTGASTSSSNPRITIKTEPGEEQGATLKGCPSESDNIDSVPLPDSTTSTSLNHPGNTISKKKKKNQINTVDSRVSFYLAPGDVLVQCPYKICHLILAARFKRHLSKCRSNYIKECMAEGVEVEIGICQWNAEHHLHFSQLAEHETTCPDQESLVKQVRHFCDPNAEWDSSTALVQRQKRNADWLNDDNESATMNPPSSTTIQTVSTIKAERGSDDRYNVQPQPSSSNAMIVKGEPILPGKVSIQNTSIDDEIENWDNEEDWEAELADVDHNEPAFDPLKNILKNNTHYTRVPGGLTKSERTRFRQSQTIRYLTTPAIQGVLTEFPLAIMSSDAVNDIPIPKSILKKP